MAEEEKEEIKYGKNEKNIDSTAFIFVLRILMALKSPRDEAKKSFVSMANGIFKHYRV